jgi:hypothetical protein
MRRWGVMLAGLALLVAACGGDGDEETGSPSAPASGSGSASASAVSACEPVGDGSGTKVEVALDEFTVRPATTTAPAGAVTFEVRNEGEEAHELVVVRADRVEDLTVVEGRVDEEALPEGTFIGEIEAFPAGETCPGTFTLTAGTYVLFCNIVEEHEGQPESHFEEGMHALFTVS